MSFVNHFSAHSQLQRVIPHWLSSWIVEKRGRAMYFVLFQNRRHSHPLGPVIVLLRRSNCTIQLCFDSRVDLMVLLRLVHVQNAKGDRCICWIGDEDFRHRLGVDFGTFRGALGWRALSCVLVDAQAFVMRGTPPTRPFGCGTERTSEQGNS